MFWDLGLRCFVVEKQSLFGKGCADVLRYSERGQLLRCLRPLRDRLRFPPAVMECILYCFISNPLERLMMNEPPNMIILSHYPVVTMYDAAHPLHASVNGLPFEHYVAREERFAAAIEGMNIEVFGRHLATI